MHVIREHKIVVVLAAVLGAAGAAVAAVFLGWLGVAIVFGAIVFIGILIASLNDPKLGVYAVAFLLPFERVGSLDAGGVTLRASQIVLLAALAGWLLAVLFRRTKLRLGVPAYVPMLLLLAVGALSLIQAENLGRGITVWLFTAFVMTLALLLPNVLTTAEHVKKTIRILFVSAAIVSAFGLYQFAGDVVGLPSSVTGLRPQYTSDVFGFPRVQSTALEPLYFANYLLLPMSLALAFFLFRRKERDGLPVGPWAAFGLLLLTGVNVVLTLSRGGYLALAGVLGFLFFVWALDGVRLRRLAALIGVLALAIAGAYGALLLTGKEKNVTTFVDQATEYSGGAGVEDRFLTYEESARLIVDHPWLGVGIGNFGPSVATRPWVQPDGGWRIVNNEYLELFAETGIFGLLSFLALIVVLVVSSMRATVSRAVSKNAGFLRLTLLGLLAALFGILIQYNTFSILFVLHIWFVIGMIIAVQRVIMGSETTNA